MAVVAGAHVVKCILSPSAKKWIFVVPADGADRFVSRFPFLVINRVYIIYFIYTIIR